MSYIRSTSNPEGLYIWSDGRYLHVWAKDKIYKGGPPSAFETLARKSEDLSFDLGEELTYRGFKLKMVKERTGGLNSELMRPFLGKYEFDFKVRLSYKGRWAVNMWGTTWDAIVAGIIRRLRPRRPIMSKVSSK